MSDHLTQGQALTRGQSLVSQDGRFTLIMQGDGNLVLYWSGGASRWASNTAAHAVSQVIMQSDGNLVIYASDGKTPLWASGTSGHPGAWLVLQDDGNLVIYSPGSKALWATGTNVLANRVPGFLPSISGLHFPNAYPPGTLFGPSINLPVVGTISPFDAGNGICGGFVFTVLDLFLHNPRVQPPASTAMPAAGSPQFNYLTFRLLESFGSFPTFDNASKCIQWIQTPGHDVAISFFGAGLGRRMVETEWPAIKADIDAGRPSPLYMVMSPECGVGDVSGIATALKNSHQVAAYAYALDVHNLTLSVYDCDQPDNDASIIRMNIADPAHTISITATHPLPGGVTVRGIFRAEYSPKEPGAPWGSASPPSSGGGGAGGGTGSGDGGPKHPN